MTQAYTRIADFTTLNKQIYTDGKIEWTTVYFKLARTKKIIYYNVPIKWTIEEFNLKITQWIIDDFDINEININDNEYSIGFIEMGQEIVGIKPEDAPILLSEQITYYDKFIQNNNWPSFYIKITSE